ncbi:hypothetical protein GUITHDRAFT_122912 [Guillardia theta CCMP2712]|uniref:IPT/TIG domain-containing protein n=1 Tax=Guillardia theta (strain CCMP2712) TaxID=905079 RepID=L1I3T7_GUITC|nr:hypothetical protein GUITHDRAFT_122912 [Guillardia theta CCMP2712]EKX30881.1 hypothetical protein GUITHDRAFT_122912 [Guillardia theta CCMP2712]|eukprot:XP_005817861.1 hypothetical protein GUITHDRAFT_122912 [Guillardia theta CCMP2712]
MPAVQKSGTVLIRAVEGAQGSSRGLEGEVRYVYYNEPVVTRVEPSSGALEGGTMLSLYGRGLEEGSNLTCRFGTGDAVAGRQETSTMATCVAPPRPVKDVVWLQVSLNGGADFSGSAVEYAYEAGATVDEVRPSAGDSGVDGQTVTVIGRHFGSGQGLSCLFGTRGRVRGMPMTSTAVVCVAPRGGPGAVGVSVSNNGVDEGQTRGGFVYSGDLKGKSAFVYYEGPERGGILVSLNGGADFSGSAVEYAYEAGATVDEVRPSAGDSGVDGQTVTVIGRHFGSGQGLSCLFGTRGRVRGMPMTSTAVVCVAPRGGPGAVGVSVSNNGVEGETASGIVSVRYEYRSGMSAKSVGRSEVRTGLGSGSVYSETL